MSTSRLEYKFLNLLQAYYPQIECFQEYKNIIPNRRFIFDFCFPQSKVAIEISGQIWRKGGHTSGKGVQRDYEKINLALLEGWIVFQLSEEMITREWLDKIISSVKLRAIKSVIR